MTITASQTARLEGNSGTTEFDFTIVKTGKNGNVNWSVSGTGANPATAANFVGGVFPTGNLSLNVGQVANIAVFVAGDTVAAANAGFVVSVLEFDIPTDIGFHASFRSYQVTNTILNDDPITVAAGAGTSSFSIAAADAAKVAGFGATPYNFTVTRTGDTSQAVTLAYTVAGIDGAPAPANSFANPSGSVSFAAGATTAALIVNTARPSNRGAEAFAVTLAVPGSAITTSAAGRAIASPALGAQDIALSGNHTQYVIAATPDGQTVVQDLVPGRDGTQIVAGLQHVAFADGIGEIDPTGNAEIVTRLYQAAFNRAPDQAGLDLFTAAISSGGITISALAASFATSPEFIRASGTPDNAGFVSRLYQNVLHRAPDAAGAQNFVNLLNSGGTRGDVLASLADSRENRQLLLPVAGDRNDGEAARLYQAALNRAPDAAGLALFSTALSNGATPEQIARGFVASAEFTATYGPVTTAGFVSQLYANVLHRAPDAAGAQLYSNALANGASRESVLLSFSDSTENRLATAPATHDGWVFIG